MGETKCGCSSMRKIRTGAKFSHPSAKLIFQLFFFFFFSVFVSYIISFKNLTKATKITHEKLKKKQKKNENNLKTKIILKIRENLKRKIK